MKANDGEEWQRERDEVLRLLWRMKEDTPVRWLASGLWREGPGYPVSEAAPILREILTADGIRWRERLAGAWAMGRVSLRPNQRAAAVETLCAVLHDRDWPPNAGTHGCSQAFRLTGAIGIVLALLIVLFLTPGPGEGAPLTRLLMGTLLAGAVGSVFTIVAGLLLSLVLFPYTLAYDHAHSARIRAVAATALGRIGAWESAGTLARAAAEGSTEAAQALRRILPALTPDHYGRLGAQAVPDLCRLLIGDEAFALDVLSALEKVGDGRAVRPVEEIAHDGSSELLRDEAERILPLLQARREQERARERLLRPSELPAERLLRPVQGRGKAEAQRLLRPHSPSND